jgi:hypothetical protein
LCAENDVTGYPTIKFFPNGKEGAIRYKGVRDLNALQDFVEEQLDRVCTVKIITNMSSNPAHDKSVLDTILCDKVCQ